MPEPDERPAGWPVGLLLGAHIGAVGVTGLLMAWGSGLPLLAASYLAAGGLILLAGIGLELMVERGPARVPLPTRPRRVARDAAGT